MVTATVLAMLGLQGLAAETVGWRSYFTENPTEFRDIPLTWEEEDTRVPDWISGTYVKNGPAQISFGSTRRIMTSWLDGFAKLHSFKMSGANILYSGKMLESPNYLASVAAGELVPQLTLNRFSSAEEEWSWWERLEIVVKMAAMKEFDNNNPALWRIGDRSLEHGIYLAVTDGKVATRFNISDLSTLGMEYPYNFPITLNGCAHYMREVGTDNSINFNFKKGLTGKPWVEVVGFFYPTKFSYMHSFSITENYAVFLFYPVKIDAKKFPDSNFHAFEVFEGGNVNDTTDVFVVNLKNGETKGPFTAPYAYSAHHINAYEKSDTEIIVDFCPTPFENMREYLKLENMLNPPEEIDEDTHVSTTNGEEATRFTINVEKEIVEKSTFPNTIGSKFINTFDFPTINEEYRGRKYCIVYGMSAIAYSRVALVKKNLCNSDEDKVFYRKNHYMGEMHFMPRPDGVAEDDGVLITVGYDGEKEQSYLLVLDAATFAPLNTAYLPHNIPWSAHGMHFPEATFPITRS